MPFLPLLCVMQGTELRGLSFLRPIQQSIRHLGAPSGRDGVASHRGARAQKTTQNADGSSILPMWDSEEPFLCSVEAGRPVVHRETPGETTPHIKDAIGLYIVDSEGLTFQVWGREIHPLRRRRASEGLVRKAFSLLDSFQECFEFRVKEVFMRPSGRVPRHRSSCIFLVSTDTISRRIAYHLDVP
ncbi:MAG: hypothetical protein A4E40_00879 [Methanoregulaceae archaeon PtaU1.Bin059]|nr:MAG: hypothetical protein A4E40_00879 [Methanoregulaceae archaeon PtaU1.Bin059]